VHGTFDQVAHEHGGIAAYFQKAADAPQVFSTKRRFGHPPKKACLKNGRAKEIVQALPSPN
jgi:hypothetical protein